MAEAKKKQGEATREAILVAAETLFAEHGFEGTRVDRIAELAGHNKALIFRYFGNKLGLYTEVLKRADVELGALLKRLFVPLRDDQAIASEAGRFRAFLEAAFGTLFDYMVEHPRFTRIINWEQAAAWQTLAPIAEQFEPADFERLSGILATAQSAGLLRADLDVALAVLLAMAARRWISRLAACAALLAILIIAGHLTQPPWWDTAADIREMADFVADGSGYEGTDEYVPAGADASELNKDLPRISDDSGHAVQSKILAWGPTDKHFTVLADGVQNIVVRLFNYPAWKAVVNGAPVATEKTETTGLMVIPVPDGEADVHIYLRRTTDQIVGDIISLVSLGLLIIIWMRPASINRISRVFFRAQRLDQRQDQPPDEDSGVRRDMRPNTTASPTP